MKFIFTCSLKPGARKTLRRGPGVYRKYAVDVSDGKKYIAAVIDGRPSEWFLVVRPVGKVIKELTEWCNS